MTPPLTLTRPRLAAAVLVPWCFFLAITYALESSRAHGVLPILAPWWPMRFAPAAGIVAAMMAVLAAWLAVSAVARRYPWARWLQAGVGAGGAWAGWHAAEGPIARSALGLDAVRIAAVILTAVALLPLAILAAAHARRAVPRVPLAAWGALAVLVTVASTTARLEIVATLVVNLVACGFGAWLLARMAPGDRGFGIGLVLSWLVGWIALGLLALALGWMGWWHRSVAAVALGALAVTARRPIAAGLRRVWTARSGGWPLPPAEAHVLAFAAVMSGTALVASLAPEVYSDAAGHHLALADRMAREHRLAFWPQWNATAQINQGAMIFAWGTLFSTHVAGKVQNFLFALAVPLTMLVIARRWLEPRAGVWAIGIWTSSSLAIWLSTTGYVDCMSAAYALGAVIALLLWIEDGGPGQAWLAGLFVGALMATKFASYTFVVPLAGFVGVTAVLRARGQWKAAGAAPVAAFAAGIGVVFLPWAVRSVVLTGNPVFPLLNHVFRSPYWESESALGGFARMYGPQRAPGALMRLPWTMTFHPEKLVELGSIGPLLLALAPLFVFARSWSRPFRILVFLTALSTVLWIAGIPYLRWFVMVLPLWGLIAGSLLVSLDRRLGDGPRHVLGGAVFALMLVAVAADLFTRGWWYQGTSQPGLPYRVVRGLESRAEYLRRSMLSYAAVEHINATAPRARVLSPFFRDHLYEATLMEGEPAAVLQIRRNRDAVLGAGDPVKAWERLRRFGYDYLLAEGGNFGFNGSRSARSVVYRRDFLSRFARLEFAHHGAYVFRILPSPASDPPWPSPAAGLENGGFEVRDRAGQPTGWLRRGDVTVDATGAMARSGAVAVRLGRGDVATASDADVALSTRLPMGSAPLLTLTLFARADHPSNDRWVEIRWTASDGAVVGQRRIGFWPGKEYDEFFFADARPAAASDAVITIGARSPIWVDDVGVAPPAPPDAPAATHVPAVAFHRASEGRFYLRNANRLDGFDLAVEFGAAGDLPLMGDWDGDGIATVGVFRPRESTFYLRNSNTPGPPDVVAAFGADGDMPVVGDWDGDGRTTIGVYRAAASAFHLRNENSAGSPDVTVAYGRSDRKYLPVVGDWDGNGTTTVGVFSVTDSEFVLRDANTAGPPDATAVFGAVGDVPVAGDWDGDGDDTIAVYRADGNLFVRNRNSTGPAEMTVPLGGPGDTVVPGSSRVVVP